MALNRVEHITILGGGTAGWLSAAFLSSVLNSNPENKPVKITLIESPNIPTVGVGEATVPGLPRTLQQIGVDEAEFLTRCNASFKLGVRFSNWNVDAAGQPRTYINPFNTGPTIDGHHAAYYYKRFGNPLGAGDFLNSVIPTEELIKAKRGPGTITIDGTLHRIGYAYHLDAALLAAFLTELSIKKGVEHVLDDVEEVELGDAGEVAALHLKERGRHPVTFILDCSGFRGLIMQQALKEPFVSFSDSLLCDRALAVQHPHLDPTDLEPCTRSTALSSGWVWRVPLFSRIGTGYVFSSQFLSDDEAIREFKSHLGPDWAEVQPRALAMRIGRSRRSWVKNCVAIGLSGGFIEPLESTAIHGIEMGLRWLVSYFPDAGMSPHLANRYNQLMEKLYTEVRDFIVMHYATSNREDSPFWLAARNDVKIPETLAENLKLWRHVLPSDEDLVSTYLFDHWTYLYILFGKRWFDEVSLPLEGSLSEEAWLEHCDRLEGLKRRYVRDLPGHYDMLTAIRQSSGLADEMGSGATEPLRFDGSQLQIPVANPLAGAIL